MRFCVYILQQLESSDTLIISQVKKNVWLYGAYQQINQRNGNLFLTVSCRELNNLYIVSSSHLSYALISLEMRYGLEFGLIKSFLTSLWFISLFHFSDKISNSRVLCLLFRKDDKWDDTVIRSCGWQNMGDPNTLQIHQ